MGSQVVNGAGVLVYGRELVQLEKAYGLLRDDYRRDALPWPAELEATRRHAKALIAWHLRQRQLPPGNAQFPPGNSPD